MDVEIEMEEAKKHKDKAIAITDVDSQYFTELSGRPVKEKFSLDQYVQDVRDVLKTKLFIGQKKDDCIRIDQQFEHESRRLQNIQVEFFIFHTRTFFFIFRYVNKYNKKFDLLIIRICLMI